MPITIVGAGPAGAAAALQIKRLGESSRLLDITGRPGGLIENAFCMENYLGHPAVDGPGFVRELTAHLQRFEVSVEEEQVRELSVSKDGTYLVKTSRGTIESRAVIVAAGTVPQKLENPGAAGLEGSSLFYDVVSLRKRPLDRALVVGVGEAALDYALSLAQGGASVGLLARSSRYKARGRLVDLVAHNPRIDTHFEVEIDSFDSVNEGISVRCQHQGGVLKYEADVVVGAVGRKSAVPLIADGLDLTPQSGVSTIFPGLFVVGDARTGSLGQVGMAVGDGLDAAMKAVQFVTSKD